MPGDRTAECAHAFIMDLAGRLKNRIQLTSDGHKVYVDAVEDTFGADIDYAPQKPATALRSAPERGLLESWAHLMNSTFQPATWSARI